RGLLHETADRMARRFLPVPPDPRELADLVAAVIRRPRDAAWLAEIPLASLAALLGQLGDVWEPVRASMIDAIALVATRLGAPGRRIAACASCCAPTCACWPAR